MSSLQQLSDCGLNPFAVTLLAESLLRHPSGAKPISFFFPIERSDCPGWVGVKFELTPIADAPEDNVYV